MPLHELRLGDFTKALIVGHVAMAEDHSVWLVCSCGWAFDLGPEAILEDALRAGLNHRRNL